MPNRIRQLRDERGLTLDQVAQAAGTSLQQVHRLERGTRRLTDGWMRLIARALSVPTAALLADEPPDNREFVKSIEEAKLLMWWRLLDLREKQMIAAMARDKGLEILANKPKKRNG